MNRKHKFVSVVFALAAFTGAISAVTSQADARGPVSQRTVVSNGVDISAFSGNAQWIWYVSKSGGSAKAIAAKAKKYGISTVFIKSGDGSTSYWSQFDQVVKPLQNAGLKVCAWQYVYGRYPEAEAALAARAIRQGADCFVVDAETEFERKGGYSAARRYMTKLKKAVGPHYPIGMSSFPYANYHPSFPYSAFFEPPFNAQVNVPQVYWRTIGDSVTEAMDTTYRWNDLYGVPIAPVAGTYMGESPAELKQFRQISARHGDPGVSYWDWQETRTWQWPMLGAPLSKSSLRSPVSRSYPTIGTGSRGDSVVWLQIKLGKWGYKVDRTGWFGTQTALTLRKFQAGRGLKVTGRADPLTWQVLNSGPKQGLRTGGLTNAKSAAADEFRAPETAGMPARAYEIPRSARRKG